MDCLSSATLVVFHLCTPMSAQEITARWSFNADIWRKPKKATQNQCGSPKGCKRDKFEVRRTLFPISSLTSIIIVSMSHTQVKSHAQNVFDKWMKGKCTFAMWTIASPFFISRDWSCSLLSAFSDSFLQVSFLCNQLSNNFCAWSEQLIFLFPSNDFLWFLSIFAWIPWIACHRRLWSSFTCAHQWAHKKLQLDDHLMPTFEESGRRRRRINVDLQKDANEISLRSGEHCFRSHH